MQSSLVYCDLPSPTSIKILHDHRLLDYYCMIRGKSQITVLKDFTTAFECYVLNALF